MTMSLPLPSPQLLDASPTRSDTQDVSPASDTTTNTSLKIRVSQSSIPSLLNIPDEPIRADPAQYDASITSLRKTLQPSTSLPTPVSPAVKDPLLSTKDETTANTTAPEPTRAKSPVRATGQGGMYSSFSVNQRISFRNSSSPGQQAPATLTRSSSLVHIASTSNRFRFNNPSPKQFQCTICLKRFGRAHNLKSHLATHSQARPFVCNVCSLEFRRQHDLKRHLKLHTGERSYSCDTCQRKFSRQDALSRHLRLDGGSACRKAESRRQCQPVSTTDSGSPTPAIPNVPVSPVNPVKSPLQKDKAEDTSSTSAPFASPSAHSPIPKFDLYRSEYVYTSDFQWPLPRPSPLIHSSVASTSVTMQEYLALQQRYEELKRTVAQCEQKAKQTSELELKVHDLQVQNRLLRSLIEGRDVADKL